MMDKKVKGKFFIDMPPPPFMSTVSAGPIRVEAYRANNGKLCSTLTECVDLNKTLALEARIDKFLNSDFRRYGATTRHYDIDVILEWEIYKDIVSKERDHG